jgi:ATP-binding cassette subfamily B protein
VVKSFIKYFKPYKKLFILDLLAAFFVAACDLFYPIITRNIMDDVVPNRKIRILIIFAAMLAIIFIIKAGLNYFMQYWGHVIGVRMQADMRQNVFTHLQDLPSTYFDNNKTGVIMSRIINDLMDISELAHHGPEDLFISAVMLLGSFIILININIPLTLIVFAILPILIWFTIHKRKQMQNAFLKSREKTGDVNASLENSIAGIKVTKSFVNKEYELNKFYKTNDIFRQAREFAYKSMAEYFSGMFFFIDILELIVLIAGGYFAYIGSIGMGDYIAYILYIKMFTQPIRKLINFNEMYQSGVTGFQRFMDIINEEKEKENPNARELMDVKGKIEIKDITFRYEEQESILENLNLKIEAGKMVALVGPSGGGKSTLCNLIPRFYDFESGDILIDGVSIKDVTLKSLRKAIGIVQQEVFLFTGTIRENIIYGKPEASEEEVIEAAKKASLHNFISSLPDGYDTYIGERGVKLSGGQKQRISIARVFLKNPPILILDEATSALDNVTEYEIQRALEELSKNRTTLVVAHRLSTVKHADEIIVLTDKGIEERGTHEELMSLNGIYSSLHGIT